MAHLILWVTLCVYAVGLVLVARRFGVGWVQTLVAGVVTVGFVWMAFHLVFVSDVLYSAGLVDVPAEVALQSVPFAWFWQYVARRAWIVGLVGFVPLWLVAALVRWIWPPRNR